MTKSIIYTPALHPNLAPDDLPDDVLFAYPGLPSLPGTDKRRLFIPEFFPFTPAEAAAVLNEMVALSLALGPRGDLKLLAGQDRLEREETRKRRLRAEEDAALQVFTQTGEPPSSGRQAENEGTRSACSVNLSGLPPVAQLKNAQKILLLAWEHENNILEINTLEQKIAAGDRKLSAALHGTAPFNACETGAIFHQGEGTRLEPCAYYSEAQEPYEFSRPEYSWRIITDALGAFLPKSCTLFSADNAVFEDLRLQNILQPLTKDTNDALAHWPEAFISRLLWVELPLWKILGYASLPQDRLWLAASYAFVVLPQTSDN